MAKQYICSGCDILYTTHKCDKFCALGQTNYSNTCKRRFLSKKSFQNHLNLKVKGKLVCHWRQVCRNCSYLVTADSKHECFLKCCNTWNKKEPSGHFWYVAPLKPSKFLDRFMYVFFDTKCTQDLEKRDCSFEHVPNVICARQMCSKCEGVDYFSVDYEQCGKRIHAFWQEHVVKFIHYLRQSRPFAGKFYVISQTPRGQDAQFLLRSFFELRWGRNS